MSEDGSTSDGGAATQSGSVSTSLDVDGTEFDFSQPGCSYAVHSVYPQSKSNPHTLNQAYNFQGAESSSIEYVVPPPKRVGARRQLSPHRELITWNSLSRSPFHN